GQEALRTAIKVVTNAIRAIPCPPEDPCNDLYQKILGQAELLINKTHDLRADKLGLFTRAYSANPGGPLVGKGTYLGHAEFAKGAKTGLNKMLKQAEAAGCPVPEVIKQLASQDIPTQPLPK